MTTYLFSFLFPFLLMMAALQRIAAVLRLPVKGVMPTLVLAVISAFATFTPVSGLPLGRWLISLNANFSVPLTALLLGRILSFAFEIRPLDTKALHAGALFALFAGAGLYPMALGISHFDPYGAGWGFSSLFVAVFLFTTVLLLMKNRFGIVLLLSILAYNLRVLESSNFWDYLVDPVLVIWAVTYRVRWTGSRKAIPSPSTR